MKAMLTVNNVGVDISGFDMLCDIIGSLPNDKYFAPIYKELAKHESAKVREAVAIKDCLDDETALLLLNDSSLDVIDNIISSDAVKPLMTDEILNRILSLNSYRIADSIVWKLDEYKNIDLDAVVEKFLNNPDPYYRHAIISRHLSLSKTLARKLEKDSDISVSLKAKEYNA